MKHQVLFISIIFFVVVQNASAQDTIEYKKRVLDQIEVKVLSSYYSQDGDNAAVTGGRGTEELTDFAPIINVAIPLNDDDILTIDASISAYTSASSSNIDPFDGKGRANPFVESTGDSRKDSWKGLSANYSHSSDDRNKIWSANVSYATEWDYNSFGFGGSYTRLFNQKNTEIQLRANVFIDTYDPEYPIEFRENEFNINNFEFVGDTNFAPNFTEFKDLNRNTFNLGINFSQILSKNIQTAFISDFILQDGLLSTPHQRVMFADFEDTIVEDFTLGNDVERLPDTRFKIALANRTNFYINENFIFRTYYRFYTDDWGIDAHTFELEIPIKLGMKYTFYPSYRFYTQTAADYFNEFNQALSTDEFYTSDYDLAGYDAHQYGLGFKYYDALNTFKIGGFGLKSIQLEFNQYTRVEQNFDAFFTSIGLSFSAIK